MSNEVLLAGRKQLTSRREVEIDSIERSRKRKLRELYAVACCDGPIPLPAVPGLDALVSQATPEERQFLNYNDLKEGLAFKENTIPPRRKLRSDVARPPTAVDKSNIGLRPADAAVQAQREGRETLQERAKIDASYNIGTAYPQAPSQAPLLDRPPSRTPPRALPDVKAPTDRPPAVARERTPMLPQPVVLDEPTALLDTVVDETLDAAIYNAKHPPKSPEEPAPPADALERDRIITKVETTPDTSLGVDPNVAIPKTAEDVAHLPGLVINGAGDANHRAATVHLPPQEVQEARLKEQGARKRARPEEMLVDTDAARLSLELPAQHDRHAQVDIVSSPGSTVGPLSATTSAHHHETSADTSPDNEAHHYDVEVAEGKAGPETPPELAPTPEEVREKARHDRLLKAQMDVARERILASSPTAADAQLLEEQAAAASPSPDKEMPDARPDPSEPDGCQPKMRELSRTNETAQELMDDEEADQDEVIGVPTPEDEKALEPVALGVEPVKGETIPQPEEDVVLMDIDKPEEAQPTVKETEHIARTPESMDIEEPKETAAAPVAEPLVPSEPPRRTPSITVSTPPIERMTTRVASGAMRHKSVSEILGETPRQSSVSDKSVGKAAAGLESSPPASPASKMRSLAERAREKERSKMSTVVFARQPGQKDVSASALVSGGMKPQGSEYPDYFMPLINAQGYAATRAYQSLDTLLATAHKTISTSNASLPFQEAQAHKIIRRIHNLQNQDKWSFRQPTRAPEPNRPTTHWDELLKEARWMRTDFREERKWKAALARRAAHDCAMWVNGSPAQRQLLQRKVAPIEPVEQSDEQMADVTDTDAEISHPTPDLVASSDNETPVDEFDDEPRVSLLDSVAPTAIFSLDNDDLVFGLTRSQASDKLLQELPMYGVPLKVHQNELPTSDIDPDASWRKPYLPLSKYIEGKIILKDDTPPRKKSRYEYSEESDDDEQVVFGERSQRKALEPSQIDVALFNPENKHIRDRIHAGHQFRPPSEYPMPLQSFFENRHPSQWTWAEDDELKQLVREYQYNWSLISSMLASKALYSSAAERRTPWECFERWIHLEGLPADMQKTHYFRAYNNRLEAAQRTLLLQVQAQAAQPPPAAGSVAAPIRQLRRSTTSIRVERRRNQKHLTLVDAMRKLAKKRETALQKQQHTQNLANLRKQNETPQPTMNKHTPQDFSKLKHEREVQMQERVARMQMQQEAHRRAQAAARNPQQNPQQYAGPNGPAQQPRNPNMNAAPAPNMGVNANRPNSLSVPGQGHLPHAPMQPMSNVMGGQMPIPNHPGMPQMPLKGIPQAQMQGMQGMQGMQPQAHRLPVPNATPDLNLVMQAQRISQQQRVAVQMQQSGHPSQTPQMHNSPPNNMRQALPNMSQGQQQGFMQSNNMAAANNMHGFNSPSNPAQQGPGGGGGLHVPPVSSPRPPNPQFQQFEASYRAKYPTASQDQIRKLVTDALVAAQRQQLSQSAMHAAAGGNPMQGMPAGMQNSPVQYAQMLRAQQERQAAAVAAQAAQQAAQQQAQGQGQQGQQLQNQQMAQQQAQQQAQQHQRSASATSTQAK